MKRRLSVFALLASLALGFGLTGQAGATGTAGAARDAASIRTSGLVEEVREHRGDRQWRRGDRQREWRRGDGNREWRQRDRGRQWRDHRRHYRAPHYRPPSGFYFRYDPAPPRYVYPRARNRVTHAHVRWCQARYRSYRAWDNTFQPYNGPRRQCISPYI